MAKQIETFSTLALLKEILRREEVNKGERKLFFIPIGEDHTATIGMAREAYEILSNI